MFLCFLVTQRVYVSYWLQEADGQPSTVTPVTLGSKSEDALRSVSEKQFLTLQHEDKKKKKKNQKGMANNR